MSAPKPIQLPDASKMPGRAMHAREAWHFRRGLGLDQDQRRENTTVIVYQQPQYEQQASTDLDVAKLTLAKLMVDARRQILYRVNELPGSAASSELWIRYRQIEDKAQALGRQGLWLRALEGFKANFQTLLTAVPTGEPVRVGYGARGVGACGDKCKNCMGCVACAGRRALDDFVSLLERIQRALKRGDRIEAEQALVRAKDVAKKLGPGDQEKAQIDLRNFGAKVDAKAAAQGVGRVRGVGSTGPFGDDWFLGEIDNAKGMASRTGNVDGARNLISGAWSRYNCDTPCDPRMVRARDDALAYVETFRRGSAQLSARSQDATGGQQAYYGSPEQQRLAREQQVAEERSLRLAGGSSWDRLVYAGSPVVSNPFSFAAGPPPVEAATGAPRGAALEAGYEKLKEKLGHCWDAVTNDSLLAGWRCLPTLGKAAVVGAGGLAAYKVARVVR